MCKKKKRTRFDDAKNSWRQQDEKRTFCVSCFCLTVAQVNGPEITLCWTVEVLARRTKSWAAAVAINPKIFRNSSYSSG